MGAYNTLLVNAKCSNCKNETQIRIQFRYGSTWNYEYNLYDQIRWGGNDIGRKDAKKVVIDCTAEPCDKCGEIVEYIIKVEDNVIKSFEDNKGQYDFSASEDYYIILL